MALLSPNRWLGLVAGMWLLSCAGSSATFAIYSPALKAVGSYDQAHINSLAVAKDMGESVGLLAGLCCDWLPVWALLLIGALHYVVGFGLLFLVITQRIALLPFPQMFLLLFLACNGTPWLLTASVLHAVRSFPLSPTSAIGLLKAAVGLSAALFSQAYATFLAPSMASYLLLIAAMPCLASLPCAVLMRPTVPPRVSTDAEVAAEEKESTAGFRFIVCVFLLISLHLLLSISLQGHFQPSPHVDHLMFASLLLLIFLPILTPLVLPPRCLPPPPQTDAYSSLIAPLLHRTPPSLACCTNTQEPPPPLTHSSLPFKEATQTNVRQDETADDHHSPRTRERARGCVVADTAGSVSTAGRQCTPRIAGFRSLGGGLPASSISFLEAVSSSSFWLLFVSFLFGAGSGYTAINNLGQMAAAQHMQDAHVLVSLLSLANFMGRFAGAYASDLVAQRYGLPRPFVLSAAQLIMAVGHVIYAEAFPFSLHIGSIIVGFCHGIHWSVVPAAASELFGLNKFGALYNTILCACPIGSFIFSGCIAGSLYDWEANHNEGNEGWLLAMANTVVSLIAKKSGMIYRSLLRLQNKGSWNGTFVPYSARAEAYLHQQIIGAQTVCHGRHCFCVTFYIMAISCIIAAACSRLLGLHYVTLNREQRQVHNEHENSC